MVFGPGHGRATVFALEGPDGIIVDLDCNRGEFRDRSRITSPSPIFNGSLSPDGKTLAMATIDEKITLWDAATGRPRKSVSAPGIKYINPTWPPLDEFPFSPDGRHLAITKPGHGLLFWDTESGVVRQSTRHGDTRVRFLPRGDGTIVSHGDDLARGRLAAGQDELNKLTGHHGIGSLALSADGRLIATGGQEGTIKLWDTSTLEQEAFFVGHGEHVTSLAWSPDGKILASHSTDGTVRFWDVATRQELERLEGHHNADELKLLFSPESSILAGYVAIGTIEGWVTEVVLWPAPRDEAPGH
jgi:WD40 repeat protein